MCRLGSQYLSQFKPRLDAANVRFAAIGLEELGVEDFMKGQYFSGELYVDLKKESYKKLGFRKMNFFSAIGSVFSKKGRAALSESKQKKIDGNLSGDGFQMGGAMVVDKDGKLLHGYVQDNPVDTVDMKEVFKVLGLEFNEETNTTAKPDGSGMVCTDEACALPSK